MGTKKTDASPEAGKELTTIDPMLGTLTPTEQAAYDVFAGEWGGRSTSTPEIRVDYKGETTKGQFILKMGDNTKILGPKIQGVIMKVRQMYTLYNDDKSLSLRTNEFDSYDETITLVNGDSEVLAKGPFKEVKAFIKKDYPTMKFVNVVYYLYEGMMYKIYVKPASRQNLWDFQAKTKTRAPFSFITELTTERGSRGATVFYPIKFEKVQDMTPEEFKTHMAMRMELDRNIRAFELMDKPSAVRPPEDMPDVIEADPFPENM